MRYLGMVAAAISALNAALGAVFAWLSLGIVVVCFSVVVLRYAFATSFVWMQDLYIWLSGAMFTAVGGFALLRDSHVRVDIFYRPASERRWRLLSRHPPSPRARAGRGRARCRSPASRRRS